MGMLAVAAVIGLSAGMASAAPAVESSSPDTPAVLSPPLRSQWLVRPRLTFGVHAEDNATVLDDRPPQVALLGSTRHEWLRGMLLRARLNDEADLSVRLRGGRIGLYVAVRWPSGR